MPRTERLAFLATLCAGLAIGHAWLLTQKPGKVVHDQRIVQLPTEEDDGAAAELERAYAEVESLEQQRDELMAMLETERNKPVVDNAPIIERLQKEVAQLEIQLAQAIAERDLLREELTATLARLEEAERDAAVFEVASTMNLFEAFTENVKVEACERGTKRSLERCHERVELHFDSDRYQRFAGCVQDHGTVPVLLEFQRDEELPQTAEIIDPGKALSRQHAVLWCDPSLPNNGLAMAGHPVVQAY